MNHNQETSVKPIKTSSSEFGVNYENQFVVLEDAKHIIGIDASDARNLIIENIENGKADKFGWSKSFQNYITTLLYDGKTGYLYTGDNDGHLYKYKVYISSKSCKRLKAYGHLGIGEIISSYRFKIFAFFKEMRVKSEFSTY